MNISESNSRIIECLAAGKVYKEVAAEMGMKYCTVVDRVKEMKKKFECKTITQLVIEFYKVQHIVP